jgi:hypothetical protein
MCFGKPAVFFEFHKKIRIMYDKYSPVDPDFYDIIEDIRKRNLSVLIHYFGPAKELNDARGTIQGVTGNSDHEEFLALDSGSKVRLDRIITLNGRPGPAFDEYDAYSLACLDCTAGMD